MSNDRGSPTTTIQLASAHEPQAGDTPVERVVLRFCTAVRDAWPRAIPLDPDQMMGEGRCFTSGEFQFTASGRLFTVGVDLLREGDEGEEVVHASLRSLSFSLA
jgi:hypothetical protein